MHVAVSKIKSPCPVFWKQKKHKHLCLKLINHSTHDHQKKEFKLAKACATEIRHLEHVCTTLEFKSTLMRRQPRDPTLGRSSASLLFPGPPHKRLCPRREPATITSRTWSENPRCYSLRPKKLVIKMDKKECI